MWDGLFLAEKKWVDNWKTQKNEQYLPSIYFNFHLLTNFAAIMGKPVTIKIKNGTVSVSTAR